MRPSRPAQANKPDGRSAPNLALRLLSVMTLSLGSILLYFVSGCTGSKQEPESAVVTTAETVTEGSNPATKSEAISHGSSQDISQEISPEKTTNSVGKTTEPKTWWQPEATPVLRWDWQIGHLKPVPNHDIDVYNVDIDTDPSALEALRNTGAKLICYFSVGTVETWRPDANQFPPGIVGEHYAQYPDESWLNYREIDQLALIMLARLDRCAARGFHAVEADNVDAFNYETRNTDGKLVQKGTNFALTKADTITYVRWLADAAHARGLAIGLKNASSIIDDVIEDIDFMVAEECILYNWCDEAHRVVQHNKPVFAAKYIDFDETGNLSAICKTAAKYGLFASHFRLTLDNTYFAACERQVISNSLANSLEKIVSAKKQQQNP